MMYVAGVILDPGEMTALYGALPVFIIGVVLGIYVVKRNQKTSALSRGLILWGVPFVCLVVWVLIAQVIS